MSKSMVKTTNISCTFPKSAFQGVPDGQDVQVRAGAGFHIDLEGPGQHHIRSECLL